MGLSRGKKTALLIGTLWPPVYVVAFAAVLFYLLTTPISDLTHGLMVALVPIHILTVIEACALLGIYAYLVVKKLDADDRGRLLWLLLVVLTGSLGQLIFYFKKVRPAGELVAEGVSEATGEGTQEEDPA